MKIDFKVLNMMDLRKSPGEALDRVAEDGEVFIIERSGQPKACLVPVSFLMPDIAPNKIKTELDNLRNKKQNFRLTITEQKELKVSFLEVAAGDNIIISIVLPHGYPKSSPRIYAENLPRDTPDRWRDGALSIFGTMEIWNPKKHDVFYALSLARTWLGQYAKWRKTGEWPKNQVNDHD